MDVNAISGNTAAVSVLRSVRTPELALREAKEPNRPKPESADNAESAGPARTVSERELGTRDPDTVRGGTRLRIDAATERIVAQILNVEREVIRQVPPEELLRIAARFREITGLIFDRQV